MRRDRYRGGAYRIARLCAAIAVAAPAAALGQDGPVAGPALPGESQIVVRAGDKLVTLKVKSHCEAAAAPVGRWRLHPPVGGALLELTFPTAPGKDLQASYNHAGGKMRGTLENARSTGIWTQSASDRRCGELAPDQLTRHWGQYEVLFNARFDLFSGWWNYCGDPATKRTWIGVRDCPAKPFQPVKQGIVDYATLLAVAGGKDVEGGTNLLPDKVMSRFELRSEWVCDGNGLALARETRAVDVDKSVVEEKTGPYAFPVRYITASGAERKSALAYWVYIGHFAVMGELSPFDFVDLPLNVMNTLSSKGLSFAWDTVKGAIGHGKKVAGLMDETVALYDLTYLVECSRTPNKRFRITRSYPPRQPRIEEKGDLYWKDGWRK